VAAAAHFDAEALLDVTQVLFHGAREIREPRCPPARKLAHSTGRSSAAPHARDSRPRGEFSIASVMTTSANCPTSCGGPMKLTQRLFSVRSASSRAFFTDSRSTSTLRRAASAG
jgi:hypothetical protein